MVPVQSKRIAIGKGNKVGVGRVRLGKVGFMVGEGASLQVRFWGEERLFEECLHGGVRLMIVWFVFSHFSDSTMSTRTTYSQPVVLLLHPEYISQVLYSPW
jgi:hypothetical protein